MVCLNLSAWEHAATQVSLFADSASLSPPIFLYLAILIDCDLFIHLFLAYGAVIAVCFLVVFVAVCV